MSKDYSPKPIEELMAHLKKTHGIEISNEHTRQMLNYGYYHAYKGYRFFKKPKSMIPFTSFEQIIAVIDYDNGLKAAFYPEIMFLETALKNIVVASVIEGLKTAEFNEVVKQRMNDDKSNEILQRQRNRLKEKIRSTISKRYSQNNAVVAHFAQKGNQPPIWAIFEIISLGDFATFTYCLNKYIRVSLLRELKMRIHEDTENQLLASILYTLKDLRNAVAHNNIIFDTRFKDRDINSAVGLWLSRELSLEAIDFSSILDYFLLIAVMLVKIEYDDQKVERFVSAVDDLIKDVRRKTTNEVYSKITDKSFDEKLAALKQYIIDN